MKPRIWIEPWTADDRELMGALLGDPRMTEHLGGPESEAKLDERHARYVKDPRQHRIRVEGEEQGVGFVGYWDREADAWETGWAVRPEFQGRGVASQAMRLLIDAMRRDGSRRYVHAYPGVDNGASNAVCRKLGFQLLGAFNFEYPPGSGQVMRCNDWRLDLTENPNGRSEKG
jgi:RimJ/RimL family protein N-acetyltransferase